MRITGALHGPSTRAAFASGLQPVFLTAGLTGLAAGLLVLTTVRRPTPATTATPMTASADAPVVAQPDPAGAR
ncbi:hypothetical protein DN069_21085 [Streptacidiphilus pinicola]|uniref:Uncharacterized protein n=1 Tax=Streptacidiphilus pinicola TaxID=2219663 RepID=A0A2X0IJ47_9ACTN|nr:hypothetical protein [Streptacidiphilus pinicola]RAG83653.1 hypothetical protein DN069_21085 [Streptacidiphilus pinicola]